MPLGCARHRRRRRRRRISRDFVELGDENAEIFLRDDLPSPFSFSFSFPSQDMPPSLFSPRFHRGLKPARETVAVRSNVRRF